MSQAILIADDNPAIRLLLVKLVRRVVPHATIIDVENGRAALDACTHQQPRLVVLDHGLPDMSGFAVLSQLKVQSKPPYVVVVTGSPNLESQARALGADDVWLKPMDVPTLLQELSNLLRTI
jgi:two-component system, OmpR family, KDP operon response regulator KdpE